MDTNHQNLKIARKPHNGKNQTVKDHLQEVGEIASKLHPLAEIAGKWHDLGKLDPKWQEYLQESIKGNRKKSPGHAIHGAKLAWDKKLYPIAFAILGHHAGLDDLSKLKSKFKECDAWERIKDIVIEELGEKFLEASPYQPSGDRLQEELLIRIIFSILVDADRESAARFTETWTEIKRPNISELIPKFETYYQAKFNQNSDHYINQIRQEIYQSCVNNANLKPGFFRLSTPTGGGKTLSVMAFALNHAQKYQKDRIIYCPPFTSIIEQSAQIYREIFGEESVLEHHSNVIIDGEEQELKEYQLAAQRWDYPVIVTTTVQLFESLFSNHPSQCRKVHRITNSVIILDEIQALPTAYLKPIMGILKQLVEDWLCSIVFCSATQPWYGILDLPEIRDLLPQSQRQIHFNSLKRVDYIRQSNPLSWQDLAEEIKEKALQNCLIVVNTRKDAHQGFQILSELGNVYHLSTNMYPKHRRRVLEEIRHRLNRNLPVYLISTQLIEAGVDVDFLAGYRAISPLDSIIQTGGRVNRNGKQNLGCLTIFDLKDGGYPPEYQNKISITRNLLGLGNIIDSEINCERYFKSLFTSLNLDEREIEKERKTLSFHTVNQKFQMISDNQINVIVEVEENQEILDSIRKTQQITQKDWLILNQYSVNISQKLAKSHAKPISEEIPDILLWNGDYFDPIGIGA